MKFDFMSEACFIVSQIFGLCLVSFQAHGQNTETCLDAPLNKERPFCCRDSSLTSSGFKCGVPIDDSAEVACNFTSFPARGEGVVKFHPTERNGLGRNDGLQNRSCNAAKNVQLKTRLIELKERSRQIILVSLSLLHGRKTGY